MRRSPRTTHTIVNDRVGGRPSTGLMSSMPAATARHHCPLHQTSDIEAIRGAGCASAVSRVAGGRGQKEVSTMAREPLFTIEPWTASNDMRYQQVPAVMARSICEAGATSGRRTDMASGARHGDDDVGLHHEDTKSKQRYATPTSRAQQAAQKAQRRRTWQPAHMIAPKSTASPNTARHTNCPWATGKGMTHQPDKGTKAWRRCDRGVDNHRNPRIPSTADGPLEASAGVRVRSRARIPGFVPAKNGRNMLQRSHGRRLKLQTFETCAKHEEQVTTSTRSIPGMTHERQGDQAMRCHSNGLRASYHGQGARAATQAAGTAKHHQESKSVRRRQCNASATHHNVEHTSRTAHSHAGDHGNSDDLGEKPGLERERQSPGATGLFSQVPSRCRPADNGENVLPSGRQATAPQQRQPVRPGNTTSKDQSSHLSQGGLTVSKLVPSLVRHNESKTPRQRPPRLSKVYT